MKHTLLTLLILALFISYASAASLTFSLTSSILTKETATTINWTQTGYSSTDTLTLNLISPSKTTPFTIATNLAVTNLSYSWQIPSIIDEGDNYTIQAIIGASTYSSSLIIITSASSVTGKIEFNLLKNNRIDYQFQLQPGFQLSTKVLYFTSQGKIEMFIRRDSPIVFNVVSALDFYDESTDISNHNSGMYNCETSAITVYVTLVNQNKLSGNMDFALQAQMTKGNDCTLPNERARNALLADQSRNTYASVMAPKNRTFTLNQQQVVWQKVTVFYDANLDTYAELWAESDSKSVIIAFRGSKKGSELNLKSDLSFEKVPCTLGGFTSGCGRIHEGFLKSYMSLAPQIIQYYKSNFIGYTIQLTGHSLGAAMATLAAFDMSYILLNTSISLSNFGSPSVGDLSFYAFFQAMIVKTNMIVYRFVHRQLTDSELVIQLDPIATIADNVGYYHVVIPVYLESSTSFSVAQGSKLHSVAGYTNNLIAFSTGYTSTPIENATSSGQSISWRSLMSLLVVLMMFI